MKESDQEKKANKKVAKDKTFSVPFTLGEIKKNISISTNTPFKPSKEKIINQAFKAHSQGNILEAAKYYFQYINQGFNDHIVFSNYGMILRELGELKEAEIYTRKALEQKPDFAEAHVNLGNILRDFGHLQQAELSMRKAIELKPNLANAYSNLGTILKDLGQSQEARISLLKAIELNPDFAEAKLNLEEITNKAVPKWHIPMMNDEKRNSAYLAAIKLAIKENEYVLEIGTGSGLLSMMAVDAGANKVLTCEASKPISEAAENIISSNGYSDKIQVLNKKSTELTVGKDLEQKADLIISEILSSEFVGEGVQSTLSDANKRLIQENGKMIPEGGEIKIALLESSPEIEKELFVKRVNGYDLSKFNNIMGKKYFLNYLGRKTKTSFLSEAVVPFTFNFYNEEVINRKIKILEIEACKTGICLGIITWLKLNLYENIYFENKPSETFTSGWAHPVYKFDQPLNVSKGQVIKIKATLIEDNVWYEFI